ncbi:MAG: PQQ-dependent sugar dehydrogenase [Gelidibacter sp.]
MRYFYSILLGFFCSAFYAQEIELEVFASGFNNPINIKNAGDGRLFVVEQAGLIQIINADGSRNSTPFLNINPIVVNGGGERGLLGLAFHPNYSSNGYFYVNYINNSGNTVISRFSRSADDPDMADSTSELQLLTYTQPFPNHNGGDMAFGADGYLYISSGDGGDAGDPGDRAQSLTTLLGKLLRIDVDNTSNGNNYAIPSDNPFFGSTTEMQEIWAYGLRNPWRFSFDRVTNDLWIADVGQNVREEINMVASTLAGANYGWRCYEGNSAYNQSGNCPAANTLTFPIAQYTHNNSGLFKCSITGGYRYRGTNQPSLTGLYFFADYCSDEIGMLEESGGNWTMTFTAPFTGNGWTTFGEDSNGEIYIAGIDSGTVYKIIEPDLSVGENDIFEVTMFPNPAENQIMLDISESTLVIKSINIYSIQGKLISSNTDFAQQHITVSTKSLSSGLYFVEVANSKGNSIIKKLIKN